MQLCFGASMFPIHLSSQVCKTLLSIIPLEQSTALILHFVAKLYPVRIHLLHFGPGGQNNQQMDFMARSSLNPENQKPESLPSFSEVKHFDIQ